jgi:hypothetical protein
MKKLNITKEAKRLAKRPYTRIILWNEAEQFWYGIVPELPDGCRVTHHKDRKKLDAWIDDLILTVIADRLERGLSIPEPHTWQSGERLVVYCDYENVGNCYYE